MTQLTTESPESPDAAVQAVGRAQKVTGDLFRTAFGGHPAGVAVITATTADGTPAALTASSVFSVSVEPPLLAFSLSTHSSSTPAIREAENVVVHLLTADDLELAELCATSGADRFADAASWTALETGEPVFTGATAWIRARIVNRVDAGTATLEVAEALEVSPPSRPAIRPLVYYNRSWHALGDHSEIPRQS